MALGRLKFSGPIVTWLTGQRDPQGGFVSTQVCQYMPKNEMYLSILKKLIRIVRITSRDSIDIRFYTFCILLVYKALEFLVHTENHQRIMGKWAKRSIRPLLWNHFARAHKNFVHSLCDLYSFVLILLYQIVIFFARIHVLHYKRYQNTVRKLLVQNLTYVCLSPPRKMSTGKGSIILIVATPLFSDKKT